MLHLKTKTFKRGNSGIFPQKSILTTSHADFALVTFVRKTHTQKNKLQFYRNHFKRSRHMGWIAMFTTCERPRQTTTQDGFMVTELVE